jgi:hypothetical protein
MNVDLLKIFYNSTGKGRGEEEKVNITEDGRTNFVLNLEQGES